MLRPASITIGDFRITALPDGAADLPARPVPEAGGADEIEWAAYAAAFPDGFHGPGHNWRIHNNCYLIEGAGRRVVVDCGVGVGPYPRYSGMRGVLPGVLDAAGLRPEDIDTVFLTHAHPDHVGWAYDEEARRPRFPNARYLLHRRDWDHFGGREVIPPYFRRFLQPLDDAGVLELLDSETELAPGLTALESPGHTPGHMSLLARSRGEGFVVAGDVLNSPMFISEPERLFGSDAEPGLGITTRVALVNRIEAEGWKVAAAHFPEPGWGDIVRIDGKRWWRAL